MKESADLASLLTELDALFGVSGYEGDVGDRIAAGLEPYVDESRRDCLGNRFFVKRGPFGRQGPTREYLIQTVSGPVPEGRRISANAGSRSVSGGPGDQDP